ncbi:MAG: hypothetical protein AAF654_01740 [Myxococcota bacterium]
MNSRLTFTVCSLAAGLVAGCLESVEAQSGVAIECDGNGQCPSGFVCRTVTRLCVPSSGAAELVAARVFDATVEPRLARGGSTVRVRFSTDIATVGSPRVTLSTDPALVFDDVSTVAQQFDYTATLPEFGENGLFPVTVEFFDINANEVSATFDEQLITVDYTIPSFAAFVANNALPLKIGANAEVSFTASEPLSSVAVAFPDGTPLGGPSTSLNESETLVFSGPVPAGTVDGPLSLTLLLVDRAGNERNTTLSDVFIVDGTVPTQVGAATPASASARSGDFARIEFEVSEELFVEPTIELIGPGEPVPFIVQLVGNRVTASLFINAITVPNGDYTIRLVDFRDRADNPGAPSDLGTLSVDSDAPQFIEPITVPSLASRVAPANEVVASFTLSEDVGVTDPGIQAFFGDRTMTCTSMMVTAEAFRYDCRYTIPPTGDFGASSAFVSVTAQDGAGNFTTERSSAVSLDFEAPTIVGTAFSRSDFLDSAIDDVEEIYYVNQVSSVPGESPPSLTFSFLVSEPVAGAYDSDGNATAPPTILGLPVTQFGSDLQAASFQFTFENDAAVDCTPVVPDPGYCEVSLEVDLVDPAGNRVNLPLGRIRLDSTPPNVTSANIEAMTLYRAPWGNEFRFDNPALHEPPLTNRLELGAGSFPEEDVSLFVLSGSDRITSTLLGSSVTPAVDVPVGLISSTNPDAYITFRDRAGNFSVPDRLRHGVWVAGLQAGGPDNPHRFGTLNRAAEGLPSVASLAACDGCNVAFDASLSSVRVQGVDESSRVLNDEPIGSARRGATAAFDIQSRGILYYGGGGLLPNAMGFSLDLDGNTWFFDGEVWSIERGSLGSRTEAEAVSFDYFRPATGGPMGQPSVSGGVLLFGGSPDLRPPGASFPCTFHVYTGASWLTVDTAGNTQSDCTDSNAVQGRANFAMAYDPAMNLAYVLGGLGEDETRLEDFWSVGVEDGDLVTTRLASGNTPPMNLVFPALAFDEARGVLVAFGGLEGDTPTGGLWEWNGSAWELKHTAATARFGASGWYDPVLGGVAFMGGENALDGMLSTVKEIVVWDGTSLRLVYADNEPDGCGGPDSCIITLDENVMAGDSPAELYAGQTTVYDPARGESVNLGGRFLQNSLRPDDLSQFEADPEFRAFTASGNVRPALVIRYDTTAENVSNFNINRIEIRAEAGGRSSSSGPDASQLEIWNGTAWERLRFNNGDPDDELEIDCTVEQDASCDGVTVFDDPDGYHVEGRTAIWLRLTLPNAGLGEEAVLSVNYINLRLDYTAP